MATRHESFNLMRKHRAERRHSPRPAPLQRHRTGGLGAWRAHQRLPPRGALHDFANHEVCIRGRCRRGHRHERAYVILYGMLVRQASMVVFVKWPSGFLEWSSCHDSAFAPAHEAAEAWR